MHKTLYIRYICRGEEDAGAGCGRGGDVSEFTTAFPTGYSTAFPTGLRGTPIEKTIENPIEKTMENSTKSQDVRERYFFIFGSKKDNVRRADNRRSQQGAEIP